MLKVFIILQFVASCLSNTLPVKDGFELHVVHLNDFHARFEETSKASGTCKEDCIGGISRLHYLIHQIKEQNPDAIVLNAGDNFQGTLWYNIYKWNVTQHFLNMLRTDVYTLGNHEFDDKIEGVVPFLESLTAPTVAVNIDDTQEPAIQGKYKKSVVIERNGKRIGVIGVLLSTTNQLSNTGKLKFLDEIETVNKEAERLVAKEKVDTIIVLSHCGYEVEQKIAKEAGPKIGLVVGAHSHTFLYTGDDYPSGEYPWGPYPTIIESQHGQQVLVVQAAAYSKFLGNISVQYDGNGDVVSWSGAPIYLDSRIPQDEKINQEIALWKEGIDKQGQKILGKTRVYLDNSCYRKECNLGNFVADSMVFAHLDTDEEDAWTAAAIGVTNAGGIRSSIEIGDITFSDLAQVIPFENTCDTGELQGKYIREMLEFASERYKANFNLLQIAGIKVVYNETEPLGSRVKSVRVRCRKCAVPKYEELNDEEFYRITVNSFLANGGDGFGAISKNLRNRTIGPRDIDVLEKYIDRESPIIEPVEGRIIILK